jgi:hypothetical protein
MKYSLWLLLPLLTLMSCEGFFGVKTPTDFLDEPQYDERLVAYVPVQPVWDENLSYPIDVIAGWDELIYVADSINEEIIAYDQAGNILGTFSIPGLVAIAQDRSLDILAAGRTDTTIEGKDYSLATIYRLDLNKSGEYGLKNAFIEQKVVHPFYFRTGVPDPIENQVSFEGIAPYADGTYLISRNGPENNPQKFGGPDDAMLRFNAEDVFETSISVSTEIGSFRDYFKKPQGIATLAQPPQTPFVTNLPDFFFTSINPDNVLKVQRINLVQGGFGSSFQVANLAVGDTSKADGFLLEANRFIKPVDIAVAGDGTNYFWVVDEVKDSLYQFNALGYEGVNPPAGSTTNKVINVSFGGNGIGLTEFNGPTAVAYQNEIVYVADGGNGRILRFKLTTDFD